MLAKILWSIGRRTRTKVYRRGRFGQSGKCMKAPARSLARATDPSGWASLPPSFVSASLLPAPSSPSASALATVGRARRTIRHAAPPAVGSLQSRIREFWNQSYTNYG